MTMARDDLPDGAALHARVAQLYPILRSITGPGVRDSLRLLAEHAPVRPCSVPTGSTVLDWTVPPEWHLHDAFVADASGTRLIDAGTHNLHVVNFSAPVDAMLTREELEPHLHSLPDQPDRIPYRTHYYHRDWGFCLSHRAREALGEGPFHVVVDAEFRTGCLDWGELYIPGDSSDEILVSTHVCHPSLANDNVSGMVLATAWAAQRLAVGRSPLSWRFVFVPGTIGAISWLASRRDAMPPVVGGLVLTGLGDGAPFTWKRTPDGAAWIDRLVERVLGDTRPDHHAILDFGPYGYDERQYCSPGFDLPVGRLTRGVHGTFAQYHTSGDDLDFVTPAGLADGLATLCAIGNAIDADRVYRNLQPYGEPQLGRRGLYGKLGALADPGEAQMAMLWLLNRSDGSTSLLDIAARSGIALATLDATARTLVEHDLLEPVRHAAAPV